MNLKYFPEHSEELNLTASLETNKKLDASGRTEMLKWKCSNNVSLKFQLRNDVFIKFFVKYETPI